MAILKGTSASSETESSVAEQIGHLGKECMVCAPESRRRKQSVVYASATLVAVVVPQKRNGSSINAVCQQDVISKRHCHGVVLHDVAKEESVGELKSRPQAIDLNVEHLKVVGRVNEAAKDAGQPCPKPRIWPQVEEEVAGH